MNKLDSLRKLIREEVRAVFQEELAGILKEAIIAKPNSNLVNEQVRVQKQSIPSTLNTTPTKRVVAPNLGFNNPLNSLLAETAQTMNQADFESFGGTPGVAKEVPIVESVGDMFAAARASSNFDAIEINAVPDFTGLMSKMKANGEI